MVLEFFQNLDSVEITGGLTLPSLFIGAIIMAVGVIIARTFRLVFVKF